METPEIFEETRSAGYSFFQGYYFCRPATIPGGTLPARQVAYLHLLAALNRPNLTIAELDDLIKADVSLCFRVLRCINSAASGVRTEIHSIRQALVLLGIGQVGKWASVWSLAGLTTGRCSELASLALIRGHCCERLGQRLSGTGDSGWFLLGLCSLLDALLRRPMAATIADLPLPADIRHALLGEQTPGRCSTR